MLDHRTILVDGNVYMWAGAVDGLPRVHDSQEKRELLSFVEVFQVKTGNWIRQQTSGTPPLGVTYNACGCCEQCTSLLWWLLLP